MGLQDYRITEIERWGYPRWMIEEDTSEEEIDMERLEYTYPCELCGDIAFRLYKAIKKYLLTVGQFNYSELMIAWNSKLSDLWDCSNEIESILREV